MKEELIKRLLELVERTGDKVVVTDPAGERPYVLMGLAQYEQLLKLDESASSKGSDKPDESIPESRRDVRDPAVPAQSHVPSPIVAAPPAPPMPAAASVPTPAPVAAVAPRRPSPPPAKPAPRREIPLWVPPEPVMAAQSAQKGRAPEPSALALEPEPEGEEQFYLEPLE